MTVYHFIIEVKTFLNNLLTAPLHVKTSDELNEYGLNEKKLINILIKRGILSRKENIKIDNNIAKHYLSYKVHRKDFNKKMHDIYEKYVDNKETKKRDMINEECECGTSACPEVGGTAAACNNSAPIGKMNAPICHAGATISRKNKNIYLTEEQLNYILSETSLGSVGSIGYDNPLFISLKAKNGKEDDSLKRDKGLSCKRLK